VFKDIAALPTLDAEWTDSSFHGYPEANNNVIVYAKNFVLKKPIHSCCVVYITEFLSNELSKGSLTMTQTVRANLKSYKVSAEYRPKQKQHENAGDVQKIKKKTRKYTVHGMYQYKNVYEICFCSTYTCFLVVCSLHHSLVTSESTSKHLFAGWFWSVAQSFQSRLNQSLITVSLKIYP
jgi:hypothetical protein